MPVLEPLLGRGPGEPDEAYFVTEKPLAVRSAAVTLPDGAAVGPADLRQSECVLLRKPSAAGAAQVWDAERQDWFDATSPDGRAAAGTPMSFDSAAAKPWQGVLANVPAKSTGAPMLTPTDPATGFPLYFARTRFATRKGGRDGQSPESAAVKLYSLLEPARVRIELVPAAPPPAAERMTLRLLGPPGLAEVGSLTISAVPNPEGTVEVRNRAGAVLTLRPDGDVFIEPKAGRSVVVRGRLVGRSPVTGDTVIFNP